MRIITIDRTPHNHGEYTATISLSYDEAVMIQNMFYNQSKSSKSIREKLLEDQWRIMSSILCHGMPDNFSILHLNAVKETKENQAAETEVEG